VGSGVLAGGGVASVGRAAGWVMTRPDYPFPWMGYWAGGFVYGLMAVWWARRQRFVWGGLAGERWGGTRERGTAGDGRWRDGGAGGFGGDVLVGGEAGGVVWGAVARRGGVGGGGVGVWGGGGGWVGAGGGGGRGGGGGERSTRMR